MAVTILSIDVIVSDPTIRGGRPSIAGRAITVSDLIAGYLYKKYTPEDLAQHYDLTLGQVYAALAYYYAHKNETDAEMQHDEAEANRLLAKLTQEGKATPLA
jgi:uncharacterized protein (DUF433 family)